MAQEGQRGGHRLSGAPASEGNSLGMAPKPRKGDVAYGSQERGFWDPVVKYTSLSCGPRNPDLKARVLPAPGGMIAVSHPETQVKHHFRHWMEMLPAEEKGRMVNCKGKGECGAEEEALIGQGGGEKE